MAENTNTTGTGAGNGGAAPSQPNVGSTGGGGSFTGSPTNPNNPNLSSPSGSGNVLELSEDSMVRLPGSKDPVRYGDYYRNFQSEFTKRATEAAKAKREAAALQQRIQDYEQRLRAQQQGPRQDPRADAQARRAEFANGLKSLPYLSGEEAAKVVDHLTQQFSTFEQALQQRDMALGLMYRQMKAMEGTVGSLHGQRSKSEFDAKISNFVKSAGLPERATQWAKELYSAYEGDDLDQEFPRIMKERWEELKGLHEESRKTQAEQARRLPFVPGRGGNGSPSRPLNQNMSKMSARQIADAMWPGVDGDVET